MSMADICQKIVFVQEENGETMKLNELAPVLASRPGRIQEAVLYDRSIDIDLMTAPVDYILDKFQTFEVQHVYVEERQLIIEGHL